MVKKILSIKDFAVFNNYSWDSCTINAKNEPLAFNKINILYGRNYSGKTTLSRIFRAMETRRIPERYDNPQFELLMDNGARVTQNNLVSAPPNVRVFNEDFVRANLQFLIDPSNEIVPFAILGTAPNVLSDIQALEAEIGVADAGNETGLYKKLKEDETSVLKAKSNCSEAEKELSNKLSNKATGGPNSIKQNHKKYGDINYNITKLKNDIGSISSKGYISLAPAIRTAHEATLSEQEKHADKLGVFKLAISAYIDKATDLMSRKIGASNKLQELLRDAALNEWVKQGKTLLEGQKVCAFCGNVISQDRWNEINAHFDEESKRLESDIDSLLQEIEAEKRRLQTPINLDKTGFYAKYHNDAESQMSSIKQAIEAYCLALENIIEQLETRKSQITISATFLAPKNNSADLLEFVTKFNALVKENNDFSGALGASKRAAQEALRLQEVADFCDAIDFKARLAKIEGFGKAAGELDGIYQQTRQLLETKKEELQEKKRLLNDEEEGAKRVNRYLNDYFGHKFITLESEKISEGEKRIRFRITRDGKPAYNLSEGECSLIAFCYFMAKLDDIETAGKKSVIWIDDPISSLDSNHVFFVYSLLRAKIVEADKYEQLFVSTHNLDFLKYLKRLTKNPKDGSVRFFIIQRQSKNAEILMMPNYMREYVTEFNYLFHEIYKCSEAAIVDDSNYANFYNFGNNARKFLEILMYYNYPNNDEKHMDKLEKFFGKELIPAVLTDRINNEHSHLSGGLERGEMPIDVPEMQSTAKLIIETIKKKNTDQYEALLASIGVDEGGVPH